jgi:uncharacterized phiE125 gp8 family phage protein
MPFSLIQITEPSHEPLSLAEVKDFLRVDATDQDAVLTALIVAARSHVEQYLNRALVSRKFRLKFDRTPGSWPFSYGFGSSLLSPYREIHLPICPVISVDSFTAVDMNTGLPVDVEYQLSTESEPARLQPPYGQAWPISRWVIESIAIEFTSGYEDNTVSPVVGVIPEPLLLAMKLMIGHWYENRESQVMPDAAKNLMAPYRVWDFAPVMNNWERWAR